MTKEQWRKHLCAIHNISFNDPVTVLAAENAGTLTDKPVVTPPAPFQYTPQQANTTFLYNTHIQKRAHSNFNLYLNIKQAVIQDLQEAVPKDLTANLNDDSGILLADPITVLAFLEDRYSFVSLADSKHIKTTFNSPYSDNETCTQYFGRL